MYFVDKSLYYPSNTRQWYFCLNNYKFYYDIDETKVVENCTDIRKKRRIKYLSPTIRINIIELMENYIKSLNITPEEVIETAKNSDPLNKTWSEDAESVFDVAFRIFIDGRCYEKDGKKIDMVDDWFNYRNSVCLPLVKKWCDEKGIRWYDSEFEHFLHRWHFPVVFEPNKKDLFVII